MPMVSVTLLDRDRQWRKSEIGLSREAPREGAFCEITARKGDTLVVEDAATDAAFADNPFVTGDPHLRFYAGHRSPRPAASRSERSASSTPSPARSTTASASCSQELAAVGAERAPPSCRSSTRRRRAARAVLGPSTPDVPGYTLAASGTPPVSSWATSTTGTCTTDGLRVTLADVDGQGSRTPRSSPPACGPRCGRRPRARSARRIAEVDAMLERGHRRREHLRDGGAHRDRPRARATCRSSMPATASRSSCAADGRVALAPVDGPPARHRASTRMRELRRRTRSRSATATSCAATGWSTCSTPTTPTATPPGCSPHWAPPARWPRRPVWLAPRMRTDDVTIVIVRRDR